MKRTRICFATTICLALITATTWAQDPIPGYLSQVSSNNLYVVASDLTTRYGPRHTAYNRPYDDTCTLSTVIVYPKNNLDMASDYVQVLFESFGYSVITETVGSPGHNVVATKTGSLYPNKFIEVTAHLDSVASTPGADDNAAAVSAVVELARLLKDYSSRHSLRFITFVGEESGQTGSGYHVSQLVSHGEQVKANLNMDGIGWKQYETNRNCMWQDGSAESLRIAYMFDTVRTEYGIDIGWGLVYPSGQTTDNVNYWNAGFPGVLSIGGLPYYKPGYHGCGDTMPNLDMPNVYKTAQQNLAVLLTLDAEVQPATWTQTDWSGGDGQDVWSDATRFSSSSGVDFSTSGSLSLSQTSGGEVVFSDDFNRTDLAPWNVHFGSWTNDSGVLKALNPPSGYAVIYPTNVPSWTDYSVEAQVQLPDPSFAVCVNGRLNPADGSQYSVCLYADTASYFTRQLKLIRCPVWQELGGWSEITHITLPSVGTGWHTIKLDFLGSRIRVYYDGGLAIEATDTSYASGGISVHTYMDKSTWYAGAFDNVVVRSSAQYGSSGTLLSSAFDGGSGVQWQTVSWDAGAGGSSTVRVRTRTADESSQLAAADWSAYYSASGSPITSPNKRWMQYEVTLDSTDSSNTPVVNEIRINYMPSLNAAPVVTTQPADQTVAVGQPVSFSAAASGNPAPTVQWQVSTDSGLNWNDVSGATATTLAFVAQASENGNQYHAAFTNAAGSATSDPATLTVNNKGTPVITWSDPADIVYGTALGAAQLNATANVPGSFAYGPAVGAVLNAGANQALNATFTPEDTENYNGVSATVHINVNKANQTISFGALAAKTYGDAAFTLGATATSGLAVSYSSSDLTVATVAGNTMTILKAGTTTITASQLGNANFNAAPSVPQALTVSKATPVITWSDPANIETGTPLSGMQLNATANVPGGFAYSPAAGTVLSVGANQPLNVTFTPNDTTDYNTANATVHITVTAATTTWTQTDWSGGSGQDVWSDTTRFASASGVNFSVAGSVQLSQTGGEVLFADDFNRTILPPPTGGPLAWTSDPVGTYVVPFVGNTNGGILQITSTSGNFCGAHKTAPVITNGSVEADIRFPTGARGGIGGRVSTTSGARYLAWLDSSTQLMLFRMDNWCCSGAQLGSTITIPDVGTGWHHLKLEMIGTSINVYWDDMVNAKISVINSSFTSGSFSVDSRTGPAINNYVVKDGSGNTVFSDDFGPDIPSVDPWAPWTVHTGSWTITNGVLAALNPPPLYAVIHMSTNTSWTDYSVEAQVQLPDQSFAACINGRLNPANGSQYTVALYADNSSYSPKQLKLIKTTAWQEQSLWTELTHITLPSVGTNWHTLKLDFLGSRIRVYYDGGLAIEATDTSYASGSISLHTYMDKSTWYAGAFDNVVVRSAVQYGSSGTLLSSAFDGGLGVQWQTVSWEAAAAGSTTVRVRTRTADESAQLATAPWSGYYTVSGSPITSANRRWIQYEVTLSSTDPASTPLLNEIRVNYIPLPNLPPTCPDSDAGVTENQTLVLSVAKLLRRASDPDTGDTLSVTAAGPTSTNGPANNVVLNTGDGTITYTPGTDYVGLDSFTYTISDNHGATVTPTVHVTVTSAGIPSPNIVIPPTYQDGTFRVTFAGIPGLTYTVQTATGPSGPWDFLKTATAGTNGLFEVTDTQAPPPPQRYYRTIYP
jgi:hypothetical protein